MQYSRAPVLGCGVAQGIARVKGTQGLMNRPSSGCQWPLKLAELPGQGLGFWALLYGSTSYSMGPSRTSVLLKACMDRPPVRLSKAPRISCYLAKAWGMLPGWPGPPFGVPCVAAHNTPTPEAFCLGTLQPPVAPRSPVSAAPYWPCLCPVVSPGEAPRGQAAGETQQACRGMHAAPLNPLLFVSTGVLYCPKSN